MASFEPGQGRNAERSERVIAADRATGVKPWTIGGFDAPARSQARAQRVTADHLPTADEVHAIEQRARDEGLAAGLAEGRAVNERMATLLASLSTSLARLERDFAATLLTTAVDLARQVLRTSIDVRPELLLPLVEDALAGIARGASIGALHVHPDDLAMVEERVGDALAHAGWKPFADANIERGGCRARFDGGEVDATIATRWERVMSQLDRPDAWLA